MSTPGIPRPARPCIDCATPTTNPGQRCDTHTTTKHQQHNQSRAYYHTTEWRTLRQACLDRDYNQCVICARTTRLTAHHIHARRDGGPDTLTNLVTLCSGKQGCHDKIERHDPHTTALLTQHLDATRQRNRSDF